MTKDLKAADPGTGSDARQGSRRRRDRATGDAMAVLDSDFRVRGTQGLRVVDASVFLKIPGYFIVSAIYMISEKALDAILKDIK